MLDVEQLAESVFSAARVYIETEVDKRVQAGIEARWATLIAGFRQPADGKNADPVDLDALALKVLALVPTPKDGAPGKDGADGAAGKDGERGPQGDRGDQGPEGPAGKDGRDGLDGKDGAAGLDGKDGASGRDGVDGRAGDVGPEGPQGRKGDDGIDGKDGAPGRDGRDGIQGLQGERGEKGIDGEHGRDGRDGVQGERGIEGRNGEKGDRGDAGPAGADGLQIEDATLEQKGRDIVFRFKTAAGDVEKRLRMVGVLLDRGIFKTGDQYEAGDVISYGGSMWIAQRDDPGTPGDASKGWRLSVKKGADGKDGAA